MNILITGHSGFLGGHLAFYLFSQGFNVYGVSRSSSSIVGYPAYSFSILDKERLHRLVCEKSITHIVNCAGKSIIGDCNSDPYNAFKINSLGVASVLEAARDTSCEKIINIETDKLYGFQETTAITEYNIPNPDSPYEKSKAMASEFCRYYRNYYNMNVISVRPVNIFGPGDRSYSRLIPSAMKNILNNQAIPVHSHSRNDIREFIYIADVVRMLKTLLTHTNEYPIYNFSCSTPRTILDIANRITDVLQYNKRPRIIETGHADISRYSMIDGMRFVEEFDYKFVSFDEAIQETYKAYKQAIKAVENE